MLTRYGYSQPRRGFVLGAVLAIFVVVVLAQGAGVVHAQTTTLPPYGKIAGVVYEDMNGNGVRDPGEPGVANAGITVLRPGTSFIGIYVATGPDGTYEVDKLVLGSYTVFGIAPDGFGIIPIIQPVLVTDGATTAANFRVYRWAVWMPQIGRQ